MFEQYIKYVFFIRLKLWKRAKDRKYHRDNMKKMYNFYKFIVII
jgi:hypothetical protein